MPLMEYEKSNLILLKTSIKSNNFYAIKTQSEKATPMLTNICFTLLYH